MSNLVDQYAGSRILWLQHTKTALYFLGFLKVPQIVLRAFWQIAALCSKRLQRNLQKASRETLGRIRKCWGSVAPLRNSKDYETRCFELFAKVAGDWPLARSIRNITPMLVAEWKNIVTALEISSKPSTDDNSFFQMFFLDRHAVVLVGVLIHLHPALGVFLCRFYTCVSNYHYAFDELPVRVFVVSIISIGIIWHVNG